MLASFPAGALADRVGMVRVLAGGIALFALAYLGFAATSASIPLLALCFAAAGIAIGCVETAQHGVVGVHADPDLRAQSFGLLAGAQTAGQFVASAVAGVLWSRSHPRRPCSMPPAACSWSLLALLAYGREQEWSSLVSRRRRRARCRRPNPANHRRQASSQVRPGRLRATRRRAPWPRRVRGLRLGGGASRHRPAYWPARRLSSLTEPDDVHARWRERPRLRAVTLDE
jgi:MFS family permease